MHPISEADPEVKSAVVAITGLCSCGQEWRDWNAIHIKGKPPEYDPSCAFHQYGEAFANLVRENRRLRKGLAQVQNHRQLRKAN